MLRIERTSPEAVLPLALVAGKVQVNILSVFRRGGCCNTVRRSTLTRQGSAF